MELAPLRQSPTWDSCDFSKSKRSVRTFCTSSRRPETGRSGGRQGEAGGGTYALGRRPPPSPGGPVGTPGTRSGRRRAQKSTAAGAADRFPTCAGTPKQGAAPRAIPGRQRAARPPARLAAPCPRSSPEPSSSKCGGTNGSMWGRSNSGVYLIATANMTEPPAFQTGALTLSRAPLQSGACSLDMVALPDGTSRKRVAWIPSP